MRRLQPDSSPAYEIDRAPAVSNKYLADNFWNSLANEVQALKDAFEGDDNYDSDSDPVNSKPGSFVSFSAYDPSPPVPNFEFVLCAPGSVFVLPGALYEPDPLMASDLCDVYMKRVERSWKIFHAPTLTAFTRESLPYLGREADAPCNLALRAAIHFSGISQTNDIEFEERYGELRADFIPRFQSTVETRLVQADVMNTNALPTLQALMLYVVGSFSQSRPDFTLTSIGSFTKKRR